MKKTSKLLFIPLLISFLSLIITPGVSASVGSWNTDFDDDGFVSLDISDGYDDDAYDVAVQSDGKVVIVGYTTSLDSYTDMFISRLNADGSLDTTFGGGDGIATYDYDSSNDFAYSVEIQNDGKILVSGESWVSIPVALQTQASIDGDSAMVVLRYNADGTLDSNFGSSGAFIVDYELSLDSADDLLITSDNKILVVSAMNDYETTVVWKLNTDGSLDTIFGNAGHFDSSLIEYNLWIMHGALDEDGSIFVVGSLLSGIPNSNLESLLPSPYLSMLVWKITPEGDADITFSEDGYDTQLGGYVNVRGTSIQVQDDGKIAVLGNALAPASGGNSQTKWGKDMAYSELNNLNVVPEQYGYVIWRYNVDGTLDASFNDVGYVDYFDNNASDLQIGSDGNYILTGYDDYSKLYIWQFNSDGDLDTGFDSDGYVYFEVPEGISIAGPISSRFVSPTHVYVSGWGIDDLNLDAEAAVWDYYTIFQVANLGGDFSVEDITDNNVELGSGSGLAGYNRVLIKDSLGRPVAEVYADFTKDLDWSTATIGIDFENRKTLVHNLILAEGVADTFTIYVPKSDLDDMVGICPGVSAISGIVPTCENLLVKKEGDAGVSIVTIGGVNYWKVEGLTGTGAFSYIQANLPETGKLIALPVLVATMVVVFFAYKSLKKRNLF